MQVLALPSCVAFPAVSAVARLSFSMVLSDGPGSVVVYQPKEARRGVIGFQTAGRALLGMLFDTLLDFQGQGANARGLTKPDHRH